ncbi:hypothetical protein BV25DRAFT_383079 [Artomyces pyxidatus]|uniref:Uncharacterized protein n=1 Tax=Artomyces pyxidatus TaxID=48021 RepID=A0ACB8T3V8_9AGAM|nr:hypothetical protein BV25DRAFT_383079 [Artomyces pyxidatus]
MLCRSLGTSASTSLLRNVGPGAPLPPLTAATRTPYKTGTLLTPSSPSPSFIYSRHRGLLFWYQFRKKSNMIESTNPHNPLAIHRLPPEIMVEIFQSACEGDRAVLNNNKVQVRIVITHVCVRWRQIALNPKLWTYLDLGSTPRAWIPQIIERAKDLGHTIIGYGREDMLKMPGNQGRGRFPINVLVRELRLRGVKLNQKGENDFGSWLESQSQDNMVWKQCSPLTLYLSCRYPVVRLEISSRIHGVEGPLEAGDRHPQFIDPIHARCIERSQRNAIFEIPPSFWWSSPASPDYWRYRWPRAYQAH